MIDFAAGEIKRRKTREVWVGKVGVGGDHPIRVQSMTTPKTADVDAVIQQIQSLENAGCDIVRSTVNDQEAADALPEILKKINIPLIADIHFDHKMALAALEHEIGCVRINPGNIGAEWKVLEIIKKAKDKGKSIRIGVNAGSLEKPILQKFGRPTPEALVESAVRAIEFFENADFKNFKVSIKSSNVIENYRSYALLAGRTDAAFHVGVTESGTKNYGTVKSSVGIGSLLLTGIGDTIRVSLSTDPVEEVKVGVFLLKSLGLRNDTPEIVACPSCGRADIDVFALAEEVERRALGLKKNIKIAVMGCVVNGPGESADADIGIAGGKGEGLVYMKGKPVKKVPEGEMLEFLMDQISRM